jgi:hypothetical protein
MKTPREILLDRHRAAVPKLDSLANHALAATLPKAASSTLRPSWPAALGLKLWQELIWPSRRTWGALAAIWLVLAVIHFSDRTSGGFSGLTIGIPSQATLAALEQETSWHMNLALYQRVTKKTSPTLLPPSSEKTSAWYRDENLAMA